MTSRDAVYLRKVASLSTAESTLHAIEVRRLPTSHYQVGAAQQVEGLQGVSSSTGAPASSRPRWCRRPCARSAFGLHHHLLILP